MWKVTRKLFTVKQDTGDLRAPCHQQPELPLPLETRQEAFVPFGDAVSGRTMMERVRGVWQSHYESQLPLGLCEGGTKVRAMSHAGSFSSPLETLSHHKVLPV